MSAGVELQEDDQVSLTLQYDIYYNSVSSWALLHIGILNNKKSVLLHMYCTVKPV